VIVLPCFPSLSLALFPSSFAAMSLPLATRSSNIDAPARHTAASKRHSSQLNSRDSPTRKLRLSRATSHPDVVVASPTIAVAEPSIAASSVAAKISTVLPSTSVPPVWCSCGGCVVDEADSVGPTPVCCRDVATGRHITDDSSCVCDGEDVALLLRDGVCYADFLRFTPRIFTRLPRPPSWAECDNAQKRLVLYAALHERVYRGGRKGQRDPMPQCIKHRVRAAYPRDS
jgi:hypothetical protein